ncbi:MAG: glycosyltransferase [Nitrospirota bacterium]
MNRKLKVLVCAYACLGDPDRRFGDGGEGVLGWNVVKQLGRFHELWVLNSTQNRAGIEAALQNEPLSNVRFHYFDLPRWLRLLQRFPVGIQFYAYLWQIKAYFAAYSLHQQFHFDVFHHVTYANDWMASFIGALLPIPYIRGPGGGAHCTPKAFLREYSLRGRSWERLRAAGQWLFRHDPFFILSQRRARAILVCNREALEAIPRKWQHKAYLFPVNGVSARDLALLASVGIPRNDNKFRVLSAGKLLRLKGFTLAIQAFKGFAERCPEAEFIIIGDGPELLRLKALVERLGLQPQVQFEGWLPREELLIRMQSCDVFLFPSLRDGGGAVVVEAMASGKPVVCLDIGGPGLHVVEECGIKVTPRSPEQAVADMTRALERLYTGKELRLQMGKEARARAEQVYHWDRLGERLLKIYQEALDKSASVSW